MELVDVVDNPDFVIFGASKPDADLIRDLPQMLSALAGLDKDIPIILLSSGDVYSDRTDLLEVSETKPMAEDRASVITSPLDDRAPRTLYSLTAENVVLQYFKHVLVLRTFEVYGPGLSGTVSKLRRAVSDNVEIPIRSPGYQTQTLLHVDDFFAAFDQLVPKVLAGARGIYNIGSSEEISLKRLADSIWQLTYPNGGATPIKLVSAPGRLVWWTVPDIVRIQALLRWKPRITIRKGLWTLINEEQYEY